MMHGQNLHRVRLDAIDHLVAPNDDRADILSTEFRDDSAGMRKDLQSIDGKKYSNREQLGVARRLARYELADGAKVAQRLVRPGYSS